jgi:DNA-binding response OmpR family regulator
MPNFNKERKRILLVDDHEDSRELATLNFTEYNLVTARDFNEGLRLARQRYFDLYILDNWLPGGSGVELCRRIREFDPHTPILFYSAAAYAKDIQEGLRAGAQVYLVKPVRFDDMTRAVARLTSITPETTFEARRAEIAAIREELSIQRAASAERVEMAKENYLHAEEGYLRAEEKMMRLKAEKAFLDAGGTRGEFARRWSSVFTEEVRGAHTSNAVDGH